MKKDLSSIVPATVMYIAPGVFSILFTLPPARTLPLSTVIPSPFLSSQSAAVTFILKSVRFLGKPLGLGSLTGTSAMVPSNNPIRPE